MTDTAIRPATAEDVLELAERIRSIPEGGTPLDGLATSFRTSDEVLAVEVGDEVHAMFGLAIHPNDDRVGICWMLTSDSFFQIASKVTVLRLSRLWISQWQRSHPLLMNYVDASNVMLSKWLRWLGFRVIQEHENYQGTGRAFHEVMLLRGGF